MHRRLPALLVLATLLGRPGAALEPPASDLDQVALRALGRALSTAGPSYSHDLIATLAAQVQRPGDELRAGLRQRLERLERHLADADGIHDQLMELGPPELDSRQTRRLVRELIAAGGSLLDERHNYLVGARLRWAAKRARVLPDDALVVVERLLAGATRDTLGEEEAGAVLVVDGRTLQYDYAMAPLHIFFDTTDAALIREAVRDVQRFVVPRVVRGLPRSPQVRFAVRARDLTALIDPEYELAIEVEDLRFTGSNTDLRPCLDARLTVTPSGEARPAWSYDMQWCTQTHGSATVHRLEPFFDEAAAHIVDLVEEFLASP